MMTSRACDSIPWDILALATVKEYKKLYNENVTELNFFDEMNGNASGGTIATALGMLKRR